MCIYIYIYTLILIDGIQARKESEDVGLELKFHPLVPPFSRRRAGVVALQSALRRGNAAFSHWRKNTYTVECEINIIIIINSRRFIYIYIAGIYMVYPGVVKARGTPLGLMMC